MSSSDDYVQDDDAVGYGKPPKGARFQKGRSGNPKGRPKGSGMRSAVERVLARTVVVTVDGRRQKVPITEALVMQLGQRALAQDAGASRDFLKIANSVAQARAAEEETRPQEFKVILKQFGEPTGCNGALEVLGVLSIVKGHYKVHAWVVEAARARGVKLDQAGEDLVDEHLVQSGDEFTLRLGK